MLLSVKNKILQILSLSIVFFTVMNIQTKADTKPEVLVTIKPLHSLVSMISDGVFEPKLLLQDPISAHHFEVLPSMMTDITKAEKIIWMGPNQEGSLKKAFENNQNKLLTILDIKELTLLELRAEDHHDHGDEHHTDHHREEKHHNDEHHADHHGEEKHHNDEHHADHHGKEKHHDDEHHADHHGEKKHHSEKLEIDPHAWLSTQNVKVILENIAKDLTNFDPEHASQYQANLQSALATIDDLKQELDARSEKLSDLKFAVIHDATHYFEDEFAIEAPMIIEAHYNIGLSAKKMAELQNAINKENINCLFIEAELRNNPIVGFVKRQGLNTVEFDPIGFEFEAGEAHYPALMRSLMQAFENCNN